MAPSSTQEERSAIQAAPELGTGAEPSRGDAIGPARGRSPHRMGYALSTLFAFATLILVTSVAYGTMLGVGSLLHHFLPSRKFDEFGAIHEPIVFGLLLAAAVFWLLPPHPWMRREAETGIELREVPEDLLAERPPD